MRKSALARITFVFAALLVAVTVWDAISLQFSANAPSALPAALAQDAQPAPPPAAPTKKSLLDYYWDGGPLMHPILLLSLVLSALVFELFWQLRPSNVAPAAVVAQLQQLFAAQNYQEAWRLCRMQPSFLTNVLMPTLERFGRGSELTERVLMDHGMKEASRLRTRVLYISVVAVISPMLGLMGTVLGMIGAFDKIARHGLGDPTVLSKDIGEALITTFFGLFVGIPAMFFFYFFRNYLSKVTTNVEDIINRLLEDVPFNELQGVKIGPALEQELQGAAAPAFTRPAAPVMTQALRPPTGVASVGAPVMTTVLPPPAPAAPAKPGGVSMVNCPNCRALILQNSRVCPNCRAELEWN